MAKRVLIVDDEKAIVDILKFNLKKEGYETVCAYDGRAALRKRPDKGLLAGLWEFPNVEGTLTEAEVLSLARDWGCEPTGAEPRGEATHIFSHIEWHMTGWRVSCRTESERFLWADARQRREDFAVPAAFRAYKDRI